MAISIEREDRFNQHLVRTLRMNGRRVWWAVEIGAALGFNDRPDIVPADGDAVMLTEEGLPLTLAMSWRDFPQRRAVIQEFSEWLVTVGLVTRRRLSVLLSQIQVDMARGPADLDA